MKALVAGAIILAAMAGSSALDAKSKVKPVKGVARTGMLIFYDQPNFNGETYEFDKARVQLSMDWNIRSIAIAPGESWEVCQKPRYKEPCMVITGSMADSAANGLGGMIGSLRKAPAAK